MMQCGVVYRLSQSERHTCATELSFSQSIPTPTVADSRNSRRHTTIATKSHSVVPLCDFVAMYPTPTAAQHTRNKSLGENARVRLTLAGMAKKGQWPTPTANDAKNATLPPACEKWDSLPGAPKRAGQRGKLNPQFVEWLMGVPIGWTNSDASETVKYHSKWWLLGS